MNTNIELDTNSKIAKAKEWLVSVGIKPIERSKDEAKKNPSAKLNRHLPKTLGGIGAIKNIEIEVWASFTEVERALIQAGGIPTFLVSGSLRPCLDRSSVYAFPYGRVEVCLTNTPNYKVTVSLVPAVRHVSDLDYAQLDDTIRLAGLRSDFDKIDRDLRLTDRGRSYTSEMDLMTHAAHLTLDWAGIKYVRESGVYYLPIKGSGE